MSHLPLTPRTFRILPDIRKAGSSEVHCTSRVAPISTPGAPMLARWTLRNVSMMDIWQPDKKISTLSGPETAEKGC
jgi:hypothetical protein